MADYTADVIVIGLGPGGEDVAGTLAEAGLDVVGIEKELVGGECPYWGCVPSKMMIRAAGALQEGRRIVELAGTSEVHPDFSVVARRIRDEATDDWNDQVAVDRFTGKGGRFVRGEARLLGADRVAELVAGQVRTRHVTNPMTATLAALAHLGVRSVALVSPYTPAVAAGLQRTLEAGGIAVPRAISFGEEVEANVARIDPASIRAAAQEAATHPEVQAVFLSCTNLRTLDVIAPLERDLGIPVLGSNLALAWHMARLAGADQRLRYGCALTGAGGSNR